MQVNRLTGDIGVNVSMNDCSCSSLCVPVASRPMPAEIGSSPSGPDKDKRLLKMDGWMNFVNSK